MSIDMSTQCFKVEMRDKCLVSLWGNSKINVNRKEIPETHEIAATACPGDGCNLFTIHTLRLILTGLIIVSSTEW